MQINNDFENIWKIGTITRIGQNAIKFRSVSTDVSDRLLNGNFRHLNSLNQYVYSFLNISIRVIFKIISIEESEKAYGPAASDKFSDKYIFIAVPLGELKNGNYKQGIVDLPMVGSNIYACDRNDLSIIFNSSYQNKYKIEIGTLSGYSDIKPKIDLDSLFSGHVAILGNTGSGKSTTARILLKSISKQIKDKIIKPKAKFIVFDLHHDYKNLFKIKKDKYHQYFSDDDFYLPVGKLKIEDWKSILSPSQRVQRPLLERALKYSVLNEKGKKSLYAAFAYTAIEDTSVDSHAARKFQFMRYFQHIQAELKLQLCNSKNLRINGRGVSTVNDLVTLFSLNYGNIPDGVVESLKKSLSAYLEPKFMDNELPNIDKILNYDEFLKNPIEITIEDLENALEFVFAEEEVKGNRQARSFSQGLVTQIVNLKSRYSSNLFNKSKSKKSIIDILNNNGIIGIDVSKIIDDDGLKLFSNFISRYLFEQNKKNLKRYDSPVYLIFDEAHRYVKEETLDSDSIFNRIAREGRKFGVLLTVISQIPSELSRIVLSQTSTFIIHRIQNSVDLDYVKRNVPAISADQVNRLSSYIPGMALIIGNAIELPMEIMIDGKYKDITPPISMRIKKDKETE